MLSEILLIPEPLFSNKRGKGAEDHKFEASDEEACWVAKIGITSKILGRIGPGMVDRDRVRVGNNSAGSRV